MLIWDIRYITVRAQFNESSSTLDYSMCPNQMIVGVRTFQHHLLDLFEIDFFLSPWNFQRWCKSGKPPVGRISRIHVIVFLIRDLLNLFFVYDIHLKWSRGTTYNWECVQTCWFVFSHFDPEHPPQYHYKSCYFSNQYYHPPFFFVHLFVKQIENRIGSVSSMQSRCTISSVSFFAIDKLSRFRRKKSASGKSNFFGLVVSYFVMLGICIFLFNSDEEEIRL